MEFWNDIVTDKSWVVLVKLAKEFDFIIIGGWAVYLHTKTLKSKDIDIIVDFDALEKLKINYQLKKNLNLKKYEIIVDEISVDIYVPFFSEFVIPLKDINNYTITVEGMKVLKPEALLILKQQAELERKDSVKGQKDRVDILNILLNSDIKIKKYFNLVSKYDLKDYPIRLREIIKTAKKEFEYLGLKDLRKIRLIKDRLIKKLKK